MKPIPNKGGYYEALTEEQQIAGLLKFNIPDEEHPMSCSGEGVWGWATPEDKAKYNDDSFYGKITAILLNWPLNWSSRLEWGAEVVLQCHGNIRPSLDPEWVKEHLMQEAAHGEETTLS